MAGAGAPDLGRMGPRRPGIGRCKIHGASCLFQSGGLHPAMVRPRRRRQCGVRSVLRARNRRRSGVYPDRDNVGRQTDWRAPFPGFDDCCPSDPAHRFRPPGNRLAHFEQRFSLVHLCQPAQCHERSGAGRCDARRRGLRQQGRVQARRKTVRRRRVQAGRTRSYRQRHGGRCRIDARCTPDQLVCQHGPRRCRCIVVPLVAKKSVMQELRQAGFRSKTL